MEEHLRALYYKNNPHLLFTKISQQDATTISFKRMKEGISQASFDTQCGFKDGTIKRIESHRSQPSKKELEKINEVLKLSIKFSS
jgi:ribosome-binding protein aMBF1 (putative translation factor)